MDYILPRMLFRGYDNDGDGDDDDNSKQADDQECILKLHWEFCCTYHVWCVMCICVVCILLKSVDRIVSSYF